MFRDPFFREFDEDPFFSMHHDRMREMDDMFGSFRGFYGGNVTDLPMAITDGGASGDRQHQHRHHSDRSRALEPWHARANNSDLAPLRNSATWDPFGYMNSMMSNMHSMMGNVFRQMESARNDPNCHSYVQSSVMTYSNTGQGEPKIYQATSATRQAPGGIRETRKAVRDSEVGIEKMSIGRHLNDRGHVITHQRNTRTGDMDENQDFLNLDEAEAPHFDEEWRSATSRYSTGRQRDAVGGRQSYDGRHRALEDDRHHHRAAGSCDGPRHLSNKHRAVEQGRRVEKAY